MVEWCVSGWYPLVTFAKLTFEFGVEAVSFLDSLRKGFLVVLECSHLQNTERRKLTSNHTGQVVEAI